MDKYFISYIQVLNSFVQNSVLQNVEVFHPELDCYAILRHNKATSTIRVWRAKRILP